MKFYKGRNDSGGERESGRNDSGANGKVGETTRGRNDSGRKGKWGRTGKWAKRPGFAKKCRCWYNSAVTFNHIQV